jgi:hypothetical protein
VMEILDHAPFAVLAPVRTLFRISQTNDAHRHWLHRC